MHNQDTLYWQQQLEIADKARAYAERQLRLLGSSAIVNDSLQADIGETRTPLNFEEVG